MLLAWLLPLHRESNRLYVLAVFVIFDRLN